MQTPRLLRLGRLLRFLEKMKNANMFRIVRLMAFMFMIAHWIACFWQLLSNWFSNYTWSLPVQGGVLERYLDVYYMSFLLIIGNPTTEPENNLETVFSWWVSLCTCRLIHGVFVQPMYRLGHQAYFFMIKKSSIDRIKATQTYEVEFWKQNHCW